MFIAAVGIVTRRFLMMHAAMLMLLLWEVFYLLVLRYGAAGNYDYFHIVLTGVLLLFALQTQLCAHQLGFSLFLCRNGQV